MKPEELKVICDLTVEIVKLSQIECRTLMVENVAPEIFDKLLSTYRGAQIMGPSNPGSLQAGPVRDWHG